MSMGYPDILLAIMPPAGAFAPVSREEVLEKLFGIKALQTNSESPPSTFPTAVFAESSEARPKAERADEATTTRLLSKSIPPTRYELQQLGTLLAVNTTITA